MDMLAAGVDQGVSGSDGSFTRVRAEAVQGVTRTPNNKNQHNPKVTMNGVAKNVFD